MARTSPSSPARCAAFSTPSSSIAHLVGHDWGGPIGPPAAARRPAEVDRIVFLNTSMRAGYRPPWYWQPLIAPGLGEAALLDANLFSPGLPLLL